MGNLFLASGFLLLGFILSSSYIGIQLSDLMAIILGIASELLMIAGIIIKRIKHKKSNTNINTTEE